MASPFIDRSKEKLLERCDRERIACDAQNFKLPVTFDLATALAIIGNLQLALRHPANIGPSGRVARETIDGMIRTMRECGLTAHAELARLGDDPAYDADPD
jgi:hypothetical protein